VKILQLFADIIASIIERHKVESERDSFREQLFFSQKMESIGQMAGGMAHDFNNQLAIIMGNAQLALADLKESSPGWLEFKEIMTASVRARELTMKLLTFARREKINPQPLSVKTVVEDIAKLLKRSIPKKISVLTKFSVKDSVAMMDVNQMHQALLNICNNAAAAMPNGGYLTIDLSEVDVDEAAAITAETAPGRYSVIKVADTGTGMPPEVAERIFEPFFTTKSRDEGTGLGLAITYGIVKNHGGFIDVVSEVGSGTSFFVYLPVDESETSAAQIKEDECVYQRTGTIMVVDDEKQALSVAERILRKFGFDVVAASNGPDAVKAFKRLGGQIDLVVLDIIMPGMDGADVFRELRAIEPDVKVILASGYSVNGQAGAIMKEGAVGFVQKPFTIAELGAAVDHAFS
jgi:nitrogen-specific signal transduction histidine kinase/CheY-like chemotaxis protein